MNGYRAGKTVPPGSLTERFLPADYADVYACRVDSGRELAADDILVGIWTDFPDWVAALFRLRNFLVRFVGLKGEKDDPGALERIIREGGANDLASIPAKNANETVMLLTDKHLDAYLSVHVESRGSLRTVSVVTLVHYKNRLGRVYFFVIRPFHGIVVKSMLKRAVKRAVHR
jgi:hypothetical protein